ncbi:hypothetical protein BASA81_008084 [Batrachochytrium salamandrivorans]|nr:hypothetical protein BASA81_008084 [Batrachochytrium salamandrivorans]
MLAYTHSLSNLAMALDLELWDVLPHLSLDNMNYFVKVDEEEEHGDDNEEVATLFEFPNDIMCFDKPVLSNSFDKALPCALKIYSSASSSSEEEEEEEDNDSESQDDEDDDDEEEEDEEYKKEKVRHQVKRVRMARPSYQADGNAFLRFYKRSVRACEAISPGTFELESKFELQYLSQIQPIPNHLVCKFKMFGELWHSSIDYVLLTDKECATVLKYSVTHLASQTSTVVVETVKEAELRRMSIKPRTICNRVFLQALAKCRALVSALPSSEDKLVRLVNLSSSGKARKCTESISLFGLRSEFMKRLCVTFLERQAAQQ